MADRPSRLVHFTPLRYPGGKAKLASYVKRIIKENSLLDGEYVEPYAGGAGIALELLFHEYVSHIHINDISKPVHAFWKSVLQHTDALCRLIFDTPLTVQEWDVQKRIFANAGEADTLSLGFAMFFLNRTNRSGILNAGVIGGRNQTGVWKIDARFNAVELANRIQSIAKMKNRISLTNLDAAQFLARGSRKWPAKTLIYSDPPYYAKGRDLYYDYYTHNDHVKISDVIQGEITTQRWIVSYDDVPEIRRLYGERQSISYGIGYSARVTRKGAEVMFFDDGMIIPTLTGSVALIEEQRALL